MNKEPTLEEKQTYLRKLIEQQQDLTSEQRKEMEAGIAEQLELVERIGVRAKALQNNLFIVRSGSTTFIGESDGKLRTAQRGKLRNAFITIMTEKGIRMSNYPWAADGPVKEIEVFPEWIMPLRNQSERMKYDVCVNYAQLEIQLEMQSAAEVAEIEKMASEGPGLIQPATEADVAAVASMTETVTGRQ